MKKRSTLFYDYASMPVFARLPRGLVFALEPHAPAALCRSVVALFDEIADTVRRNFHPRGRPRLSSANYTRFTGDQRIEWHSDGGANRLAFVFYLNDLRAETGGQLIFGEPRKRAVRSVLALTPTENTLVLFEVPRVHRVEPVEGGQVRHALSGWWTW